MTHRWDPKRYYDTDQIRSMRIGNEGVLYNLQSSRTEVSSLDNFVSYQQQLLVGVCNLPVEKQSKYSIALDDCVKESTKIYLQIFKRRAVTNVSK